MLCKPTIVILLVLWHGLLQLEPIHLILIDKLVLKKRRPPDRHPKLGHSIPEVFKLEHSLLILTLLLFLLIQNTPQLRLSHLLILRLQLLYHRLLTTRLLGILALTLHCLHLSED